MRKMMFTMAAWIAAHATFAQITIAPEIGLNMARVAVSDDVDYFDISSIAGPKFGVYVNVPLIKGLFFQPGIQFSPKGFQTKFSEPIGWAAYRFAYKINANYIEIPLNIGYNYSLGKAGSLFVTAGPYLGYGIGGNVKESVSAFGQTVTMSGSEYPKVFGSGDSTLMKHGDLGMNFSLGYQSPLGIYARFQYGMGLTNVANGSDDASIKNKCIGISVGYAIKLNK